MVNRNPVDQGQSKRVQTNEARAVIGRVPLVDFSEFDLDISDPSPREDTVDGNRIDFDQLTEPSGSASVYPTSASIPGLFSLINDRAKFTIRYAYPSADQNEAVTFTGARLTSFGHSGIGTDSYTYDVEWRADFVK